MLGAVPAMLLWRVGHPSIATIWTLRIFPESTPADLYEAPVMSADKPILWYIQRPGQKREGPFSIEQLRSFTSTPVVRVRRNDAEWVPWLSAHQRYPELVVAGIVKPIPAKPIPVFQVSQGSSESLRPPHTDGQLQVTAAVSLLEHSRLIDWSRNHHEFTAVGPEVFEFYWQKAVDPVFGRLICWISFSAGAELLLKGICLLRGIEIRQQVDVVRPPHGLNDYNAWASAIRGNWKSQTIKATSFGTLGGMLWNENNADSVLERLCVAANATRDQEELLIACYQLLRTTIRNRDAHAYVPNVRHADFPLVRDLFVPCFNYLASWLPEGPEQLDSFKDEAGTFIAAL